MTKNEAYEQALEFLETCILLQEAGDPSRQQEAEDLYSRGVAIRDKYFPDQEPPP
jgi:hypothetical protein